MTGYVPRIFKLLTIDLHNYIILLRQPSMTTTSIIRAKHKTFYVFIWEGLYQIFHDFTQQTQTIIHFASDPYVNTFTCNGNGPTQSYDFSGCHL